MRPESARVPWRVLWWFALRELRGARHGVATLLVCLGLGVAAIAASGSLNAMLSNVLTRDAQILLGGDLKLELTHRPATAEERATLAELGAVTHQVTMRSQALRADDETRRALVELKAVDGKYPLYGRVQLADARRLPARLQDADGPQTSAGVLDEQGAGNATLLRALAPADGVFGAVVADELLVRLGLAVGEQIRIGDANFEIRAVLAAEPDNVASFASFGPRVMVSGAGLERTGLVARGALVRHLYLLKLPPDFAPARAIDAINRAHPKAGWRISRVEDAVQGLAEVYANITLFFSLTGLTTLLIGGIGVANAVQVYLERRQTTIAALKCLGASTQTVFRIYALQVALLAGLAIALGLVLGALVPGLVAARFPSMLPTVDGFGIAPGALAEAALFGALVTASFTLLPLLRLRAISPGMLVRGHAVVAEAPRPARVLLALGPLLAALVALTIGTAHAPRVAAAFVVAAGLGFLVLRLAAWLIARSARLVVNGTGLTHRRPVLHLALSNLYRPGALTVSVVLSLGLGLTVLVAVAQIETNLKRQINDRVPDEAPQTFFLDIQKDQVTDFESLYQSFNPAQGALALAPMIRGRISALNGVPVAEAEIDPDVEWAFRGDRGLSYSAVPVENSEVVAGVWWPEDYSGPNLVSMDANIARGAGLGVGDTITINVLGREITAEIASLREIRWQSARMNFTFVYTPDTLAAAPVTFIATLHAEPEAARAFEDAVIARFSNVTAISVAEAIERVNALLTQAARVIRMIASVALLAGCVVLASAVAGGQHRRLYEATILKVLGGTRRRLLGVFMLEFGLLGLGTSAFACAAGTLGAAWMMKRVMQAEFVFAPGVALGVILLGVVTVLGAGAGTLYAALSTRASQWLRND